MPRLAVEIGQDFTGTAGFQPAWHNAARIAAVPVKSSFAERKTPPDEYPAASHLQS
jgi:hypothetical protein